MSGCIECIEGCEDAPNTPVLPDFIASQLENSLPLSTLNPFQNALGIFSHNSLPILPARNMLLRGNQESPGEQ
jgi:hypothetical protein